MSDFKIIDPIVALQGGDMKKVYPSRDEEITRLRALNAELLAALMAALKDLEQTYCHVSSVSADRIKQITIPRARAAIEKARQT